MKSLIIVVKIFLAYWIAASLVIIIYDLHPHQHMHNPDLSDALDESMDMNARSLIQSYEASGCPTALGLVNDKGSQISLATPDGKILCGNIDAVGVSALAARAGRAGKRITRSYSTYQVIAFPERISSSHPYVLLVSCRYKSAFQFYGLLPGYTAVITSGVVTLLLALLLVLPIRRLRTAAHQISLGNLGARVQRGFISSRIPFSRSGDDLESLATDFNHMADRLQVLVGAQQLLLRDVSHELRSPLARVSLALELARSESRNGPHKYLDRIQTEIHRLNELISQLMDISYLETTHEPLRADEVALDDVVMSILPDMQFEASGRKCHINTVIIQPCVVRGDAGLLRRAFENIIRNAIAYTPEAGVISIDLCIEENEGEKEAILSVSDCGPGVPEEELQAILNPFYRVDASRQSSSGGFGIGLAIADKAIRLHNGEIQIRNRKQGGLIVELHVPLHAMPVHRQNALREQNEFRLLTDR